MPLLQCTTISSPVFDRAESILGINIKQLCFEGPADALEATDISQPAIFLASLAALESLKATRPELLESIQGAAGLSLGEYTALVFSGAMDFETGLRVVRERGRVMQAAAMAFAVMFRPDNSFAKTRVRAITPALAAE